MADDSFDFAILGATPLAVLVAGLLAEHGKSVCLVGEPFSPFRLQRSLDISIAPLTRPESLILLKGAATETGRLLAGWGKGNTSRVDPLFIAEQSDSIAALGHFRQLAIALGYAVEPVVDRTVGEGQIMRVRDALMLAQGRFEPAAEAWLSRLAVSRFDQAGTALSIRKDGIARLTAGGRTIEAQHAALLSDEAILRYLPAETLDRSLVRLPASTSLLEGRRVSAPYICYLDRGIVLGQEPKSTSLTAIVTGTPETARARLGGTIARSSPVRLAGETVLPLLRPTDGAPFVGPARGLRATLVTALGPASAFLAPVIARHLLGTAAPDEATWLAARGPGRGNQRLAVSDFAPVPA